MQWVCVDMMQEQHPIRKPQANDKENALLSACAVSTRHSVPGKTWHGAAGIEVWRLVPWSLQTMSTV